VTHPPCLRLGKRFDPERLRADLGALLALKDYPWPDKTYSPSRGGDVQYPWNTELPTCVALISRGGRWDDGSSGIGGMEPISPTPLLQHAPYFQEILSWFDCPKPNVRLSGLRPGGLIDLHADPTESLEHGIARFHIPIVTNDQVSNMLGDRYWKWEPGELWYADFTRPHRVENKGPALRVHLLVSTLVNDFVLGLFPPELLEGRQIRKYEPAARVPAGDLPRYQCRFFLGGKLGDTLLPALLPRGVGLGSGGGGGAAPAGVRLRDGQLALCIADRPVFRLEPLPGDRLGFEGLPFARLLYRFEGPRVSSLSLDIKFDNVPYQVPLPLAA